MVNAEDAQLMGPAFGKNIRFSSILYAFFPI